MSEPPNHALEARFLSEIADIRRKISDLEAEQRTLERLLIRVRGENLGNHDVTRKNSINRLLVENAILKTLGERPDRPFPLPHLWRTARLAIPGLKEPTFRSYLNRLKARGAIRSPEHGKWQIAPPPDLPAKNVANEVI